MNNLTESVDNFVTRQNSCNNLSNNDCIKKIYPSITELSVINNYIKCTEEKCQEIFTSHSNLNLHLYKTHKKKDAIQFDSIIKQFHCPDVQCVYNQLQWFKNKKLLKQHYLKVHSPKTYICANCQEGFPTKAFKNMHEDYCGVKFKCCECPVSYPKYESLLTHARRKEHKISDKIHYKLNKFDGEVTVNSSKSDSYIIRKERLILPKPITSEGLNTNLKLTHKTSDQSIQTDHIQPKIKSKLTQINVKSTTLSRENQQTQTGLWKERSSIETQTIGDFFRRETIGDDIHKKFITRQSSTQTNEMLSKSVLSNPFFPSNNIELHSSDVKRSSSSTQTLKLSKNENFSASCAVNTDTSDLIANNLESFDSNFFNCNMETQTDLIFDEDLFSYGDYYSNMYTQTCEDLFLNSLELNHIETQTVDDMLKSVEIQTLPHRKPQISCRDTSHMETQTDLEFKEILDAINA